MSYGTPPPLRVQSQVPVQSSGVMMARAQLTAGLGAGGDEGCTAELSAGMEMRRRVSRRRLVPTRDLTVSGYLLLQYNRRCVMMVDACAAHPRRAQRASGVPHVGRCCVCDEHHGYHLCERVRLYSILAAREGRSLRRAKARRERRMIAESRMRMALARRHSRAVREVRARHTGRLDSCDD